MRKEGLLATAGRPEPVPPPEPLAPPLVAIAVGKTKEGESFPANPARCIRQRFVPGGGEGDCCLAPSLEKPVPLSVVLAAVWRQAQTMAG